MIPLFKLLPLKDKVIFSNFFGNPLGDDPKYILEELLKVRTNVRLVWVAKNHRINVPNGVIKVRYKSIGYYYHICTAKVWVFNIRNLSHPLKREGQFYIQTWHATTGIKMAEAANETYLPKEYVKQVKKDALDTDLMYTNNDSSLYQYKNYFWYNGLVVKMDVPRTGALMKDIKCKRLKVENYFNIKNKKIILYAPTFRKCEDVNIYIWNYKKVLSVINKKFNEQHVLMIRLHPNISHLSQLIQYDEDIINASTYPDMQELLATADILVNDFSSTMFEFAYMSKPVFLFASDFDNFIKTERNLFYKFEELPFNMTTTIDDLCHEISAFDDIVYKKKCDSFYKRISMVDTGHGSEKLCDIIINFIKSGEYDIDKKNIE